MARFIQAEFPTEHAGVARFARAAAAIRDTIRGFDGARGAATLLLAALVSALLVVANQVVDTWTEGHLLAAWIVMWLVGFAALALFAAPARSWAVSLRATFVSWKQARREAIEDERLWNVALTDARVMADLSRAMSRDAARDVRGYY
jgi:hypothetical protein